MSEAFRGFDVSSKGENNCLYVLKSVTQTCLLTFLGEKKNAGNVTKKSSCLFIKKKKSFLHAGEFSFTVLLNIFLPFFAIITF